MARIRSVKRETPGQRWDREWLAPPFRGAVVYRAFDGDRRLLYVGFTTNTIERLRRHAQKAPWWPLVEDIELTDYTDEVQALDAERGAIKAEGPAHNIRSVVTV
jgi:excinuclease UvrABC nuclease subunit